VAKVFKEQIESNSQQLIPTCPNVIQLWQRYSKNKLKAIHNREYCNDVSGVAVAKVFKEQIESNSQQLLI